MVDSNFNAYLPNPEGSSYVEEIVAELVSAMLEDMSVQFLLRRKSWSRDGHTCSMLCRDMVENSWTDCLLRAERRLYQNVLVKYA